MNWKRFYNLLDRYQKGNAKPDEKRLMDLWYDSLSEEEQLSFPPGRLKEEMWAEIRAGMDGTPREPVSGAPLKPAGRRYLVPYAAAAVLVAGLLGYLFLPVEEAGKARYPQTGWTEQRNASGMPKEIRLEDGSYVHLDPGASLHIPRHFAPGKREVFLSGGGFFHITPDTKRPFYVFTETLVTKVLGTSFTIRKNRKMKTMEVSVLTGKVEVRKSGEVSPALRFEEPVVLTPHRKIVIPEEGAAFVTRFAPDPAPANAPLPRTGAGAFVFREISVETVLSVFEKVYGVRVELSDPDLLHCVITADMSQDETLEARLEILCAAIDANFHIKGNKVYLEGTGCPP